MDGPGWMALVLALLAGALMGGCVVWLWARGTNAAALAGAAAERDALRERVADLEGAAQGADRTQALLSPLLSTIDRVERQVGMLERDRSRQYGALDARLADVGRSAAALQAQTASLSSALSASTVRGAWGEVQLRRVLEVAGLLARCDVEEQVTRTSRHDKTVRPDAVVHLPADRHLVVDAKAPMTHFLAAHAEGVDDRERGDALDAHARALRRHVDVLAGKQYWTAFTQSPEFVICFVPGEALVTSALAQDPGLYEYALARKVVIASPGTLFVMLKTVGTMWQQDSLHANAQDLLALGSELYQRLGTLGTHLSTMGASLGRSVESYNRLVGTLESRVLVTARRLHELDLAAEAPTPVPPVSSAPRSVSAPELVEGMAPVEEAQPVEGMVPVQDAQPVDGSGERDLAFLHDQGAQARGSKRAG